MKRKFLSVLLCVGMTSALLAGCGGSGGNSANEGTQESVTAGESTSAQESGAAGESAAVSEAPEGEETQDSAGAVDEESEALETSMAELNDYGLTDEQQEALLASVKASITEGFLEPYGIAAADFYVNPYNESDMMYYTNGTYTGDDIYEWSSVWYTVNRAFLDMKIGEFDLTSELSMGIAYDKDGFFEDMEENGTVIEDELSQQYAANLGAGLGDQYSAEASNDEETQVEALSNAVYRGIAGFLNSLEPRERADVIYEMYFVMENNTDLAQGIYPTLFDRVLSENLQFE